METELYVVHCNNPRKVSLNIVRRDGANNSAPEQKAILVKPCPRIDGRDVEFEIEVHFGVPVSASCGFSKCNYHSLNNASDVNV